MTKGKISGEANKDKTAVKPPRKKPSFSYQPELALRVNTPPEGKDWLHEIKFDGYRTLLHLDKGKVTIITRNGLDWTEKFPEIVKAAESLNVKSAALDGEIVVFKTNGKTDFSSLQQTLSGEAKQQMTFIAFDILEANGVDCKKLTLLDRKKALKDILKKRTIKSVIQYSDYIIGNGGKVFAEAQKHGLEGIISKNIHSAYASGRHETWLKIKHIQVEEFVIGGILRRSDNKDRVGAVLLGQFEGDKFIYKGKSGTGFPEALSDQILKKAKSLNSKTSPFASGSAAKEKNVEWLEPQLVCMIDYTEMTSDGHVRHGVFKGLREDKPSAEVKPEVVTTLSSGEPAFAGVTITHPERVVYPENGYTKSDVARYYDRVADLMLPYLKDRAVSIIRCPDGLKDKCFFQRHISGKTADKVTLLPIKDTTSGEPYFAIDTKEALLSMVQFGAIEFHPWGSKAPNFDKPDRLIFDLDPDPKIDLPSIKASAVLVKERLEKLGLKSFIKTTGGKGLHVVVPIRPIQDWKTIKDFTHRFVETLEAEYPTAFVTTSSKEKRKGKIYLDYLRNDETSTSVAPFSLRARQDAPISIPLQWTELKMLRKSDHYSFKNISRLLKGKYKDPWAKIGEVKQKITSEMIKKVNSS